MTPDLESPEQSLTPEEILELLRTRLTVDPAVVQQALGIGEWALDGAIKRGVCPAIDLGPGAKRKPIPSWWVLKMLGLPPQQLSLQEGEPLQELSLQEGEPLQELSLQEGNQRDAAKIGRLFVCVSGVYVSGTSKISLI